jgi:GntR family transcriptional regulator
VTSRGHGSSSDDREATPGQADVHLPQPAIEFRLDPLSGVPTYRQLVTQVEQALRLGYLRRGDQLPKVKEVVRALAINPNTVLKAYHELEVRGLVSAKPGSGTFIERELPNAGLSARAELRRRLMHWLQDADEAGLDGLAIEALLTLALHEFLTKLDKAIVNEQSETSAESISHECA